MPMSKERYLRAFFKRVTDVRNEESMQLDVDITVKTDTKAVLLRQLNQINDEVCEAIEQLEKITPWE